jgi:putative flippase GtrA
MYKKKKSRGKKKQPYKKPLSSNGRQGKSGLTEKNTRRQSFWQVFKFIIVGGLATATHAGLFIFIMEANIAQALQANFIAFAVAFLVSFLGQYHWTFKNSGDSHWAQKMLRFMVVALIGLGLNTAAVYIIVDKFILPYSYAVLFMTTIVPVTTFIINKKWAFS